MMVNTISISRSIQFCNFYMHSRLSYSESDILSATHVLIHTLLKMKKRGIFFYYYKKN